MASAENHTVRLPRARSPASYSRQFVTRCRYHGLDKGAEKALGLALIFLREELRTPTQRARVMSAMPISQPRQETPSGDGGVDNAAAAQDSLAVQSGGGPRAAAGRAGGAEGRLPASPAAAVAPGPPHPTNAAERGGA